ncbi:hypothetical protein ANN_02169 [Periplaneta americana]|uniref:Uncharacterized protein n=1 Tax=Periplaneta americana TaxID=6978 RepID=A0ABQ8TZ01_PERAM|nr:hypothetical protein ANN_02169 [Periplaneta americana]
MEMIPIVNTVRANDRRCNGQSLECDSPPARGKPLTPHAASFLKRFLKSDGLRSPTRRCLQVPLQGLRYKRCHSNSPIFHTKEIKGSVLENCSELETLGHVLGQCPKGELLINARHHRVRQALAISLKTLNWKIHEEVHCVSSDGSFRRADIIAINGRLKRALVLDPTIRFERNINQTTEVDIEKKTIYEPCLPYLSQKYNIPLKQWSVIGLLFGSRGSITKFTWNYLKELHIPFDYVGLAYPACPEEPPLVQCHVDSRNLLLTVVCRSISCRQPWFKRRRSQSEIVQKEETESRRLRWAGHVARMGESRNAYRVLVGRPEGKRHLGRPRRRWEDNIKMDLREVAGLCEGGNEPPGSLKARNQCAEDERSPTVLKHTVHNNASNVEMMQREGYKMSKSHLRERRQKTTT